MSNPAPLPSKTESNDIAAEISRTAFDGLGNPETLPITEDMLTAILTSAFDNYRIYLQERSAHYKQALESIAEYDCPGGVSPKHCIGCAACDANKALDSSPIEMQTTVLKHVVDPGSLREMADDCERFNNTPPIQAEDYQRLYLRVTRYAPRYLREAAEQLEQMRQAAACNHPRSELLARKGNQFEMRKCLDCTKIFRVRLPEKAPMKAEDPCLAFDATTHEEHENSGKAPAAI